MFNIDVHGRLNAEGDKATRGWTAFTYRRAVGRDSITPTALVNESFGSIAAVLADDSWHSDIGNLDHCFEIGS